jgi:hypothetical protein
LVLGSSTTEVTVANLSGSGSAMLTASADGTLSRATGFSVSGSSLGIAGGISVAGATTLSGGATINQGLAVSGGTTTDTLMVSGATTLNGATTINNSLTVNGDQIVSGNQTIGGSLQVTGASTFAGGAMVNQGLVVSGGTSTDALNVSGASTLNTLDVSGDSSLQGSLAVQGPTTLNGATTINDELTVSSLSGSGTELIGASSDGTLKRSSVSMDQMETAVNTKIPKLESAARGLGRAVETSGAIASAMSAIPEVTLQEDEPMRCGVGTGGFGSQYAFSAGCAVRVGDRLHLNGALSYSPSVDYNYGSTPSVAGRLGFSFPLGRIAKASTTDEATQVEGSDEIQKYLSEMEGNIDALQSDVELRDGQIDALKEKLDALLNGKGNNQQQGSSITSEATTQLITMLKQQIMQLEEEKKASEAEDQKRDLEVVVLRNELNQQREEMAVQEEKLIIQDSEIKSLRKTLLNVMSRLGME